MDTQAPKCIGCFALALAASLPACGGQTSATTEPSTSSQTSEASTTDATGGSETDAETETDTDTDGMPLDQASVIHSFGEYALEAHEEVQPCVQWTLHNEKPIYINTVTLANDGAFHHSNWFVIPEDTFPGEDGYYKCSDRNFTELGAALAGSVLFAQSTQSKFEQQPLPEGVVIKVPPRHKVVSSTHMLNLSSAPFATELRMTLDIIHPRTVEVIAAAFRLTYSDLDIPAQSESRFTGECAFDLHYESATGQPLDIKLYYALPHYHYLGNHFSLEILGGPQDGTSLFQIDGFNADANGYVFDPPIDLTGANGLRFTCGYNNWTNSNVGWGIDDQEMCVMLGLMDGDALLDANVSSDSQVVGVEQGVVMNEGPCTILAAPKSPSQGPPTPEEIEAPLYVPPSDPGEPTVPVDPCIDIDPAAAVEGPATLSSIHETIFVPNCTFSSCHGSQAPVAGLDLDATDLHGSLLSHPVQANTDLSLVDPGSPETSWLYQLIAQCDPLDRDGVSVRHMPLNSPRLLDPGLVAKVRQWIEGGAPNN